jgi:hypothetical protein
MQALQDTARHSLLAAAKAIVKLVPKFLEQAQEVFANRSWVAGYQLSPMAKDALGVIGSVLSIAADMWKDSMAVKVDLHAAPAA